MLSQLFTVFLYFRKNYPQIYRRWNLVHTHRVKNLLEDNERQQKRDSVELSTVLPYSLPIITEKTDI